MLFWPHLAFLSRMEAGFSSEQINNALEIDMNLRCFGYFSSMEWGLVQFMRDCFFAIKWVVLCLRRFKINRVSVTSLLSFIL